MVHGGRRARYGPQVLLPRPGGRKPAARGCDPLLKSLLLLKQRARAGGQRQGSEKSELSGATAKKKDQRQKRRRSHRRYRHFLSFRFLSSLSAPRRRPRALRRGSAIAAASPEGLPSPKTTELEKTTKKKRRSAGERTKRETTRLLLLLPLLLSFSPPLRHRRCQQHLPPSDSATPGARARS